jgi:hypothetical protein
MNTHPRFCKTAKAWDMLVQPARIGRCAHSLLLLANGQRSEEELSLLLGTDVSDLARNLQAEGYLQPVDPAAWGDADSALEGDLPTIN